MLECEVLVLELLTVDGLAASTLESQNLRIFASRGSQKTATHVLAGEVTTLEHELGNDTVEGRALVAEAVLTGRELTEVAGGLGNDIVEELEFDAA